MTHTYTAPGGADPDELDLAEAQTELTELRAENARLRRDLANARGARRGWEDLAEQRLTKIEELMREVQRLSTVRRIA